MKSLLKFVVVFFIGMLSFGGFASEEALAQDYDGVCCQTRNEGCAHPNGLIFADAGWRSGSSTCTL